LMTSSLLSFFMHIGSFNGGEDTTLSLPVTHTTTTTTDTDIAAVCDFLFQWMTRSNTDWAHWEFNVSARVLLEFLIISRDTSGGNIRFGRQHDSEGYLLLFERDAGTLHRLELEFGTTVENSSELRIDAVVTFLQSCRCAVIFRFGDFPVPPLILDALSGMSRIVDLILDQVPNIGELVFVLRSNESLLCLAISNIPIGDENWTTLCQSLESNSTLVHLRLHRTFPHEPAHTSTEMMEMKARRTGAFLRMLRVNTALWKLDARDGISDPQDEFDDDELTLLDVILPYLRVSSLARTDPRLGLYARALSIVIDLMLVHSNTPTISLWWQGNEQEAVVPNA
jgi:hypothetical protein